MLSYKWLAIVKGGVCMVLVGHVFYKRILANNVVI